MIIAHHEKSNSIVVVSDTTAMTYTRTVLHWVPALAWMNDGTTFSPEVTESLKIVFDRLSGRTSVAFEKFAFGLKGTSGYNRECVLAFSRDWFTPEILAAFKTDVSRLNVHPTYANYVEHYQFWTKIIEYVESARISPRVYNCGGGPTKDTVTADWRERLWNIRIPTIATFLGLKYSILSDEFKQSHSALVRSFAVSRGVSERLATKVFG